MSGISTTSAAYRARQGLLAAVRIALAGEDVDIDSGFFGPAANADWVAAGDISVIADPKNVGPRRQRDETITLELNVGSWRDGSGDAVVEAAFGRVDVLLAKISAHVSAGDNATLGGVVLWCLPGSAEWAGAEYQGGFQVEVAATFVCTHRVRAD